MQTSSQTFGILHKIKNSRVLCLVASLSSSFYETATTSCPVYCILTVGSQLFLFSHDGSICYNRILAASNHVQIITLINEYYE